MTINEPDIVSAISYRYGLTPPGISDPETHSAAQAALVACCHAGRNALRQVALGVRVGWGLALQEWEALPGGEQRLDDGAALERRRAAPAGGDREPLDASPDHRRLGGLRATIGTASAYAARPLRHKGRGRNRPTPAGRTPGGTAGSPPTPLMLPSASSPLSLLMPLRAGQPYTHDGASEKRESSRPSRIPGASGARFSSQGRSRRGSSAVRRMGPRERHATLSGLCPGLPGRSKRPIEKSLGK